MNDVLIILVLIKRCENILILQLGQIDTLVDLTLIINKRGDEFGGSPELDSLEDDNADLLLEGLLLCNLFLNSKIIRRR